MGPKGWELLGWGLFVLAGIMYTTDAALQASFLYLAGSVTWTCGCLAFLYPLIRGLAPAPQEPAGGVVKKG